MSGPGRFDLDGRTALVTGAARGLGRAITLALAEAGADVALGLRDRSRDEGLADDVRAIGRRVLPLQMDVTRLDEVDAAVATTVEELGSLDLLVNNAGGGVDQMPVEEFLRNVDRVTAEQRAELTRLATPNRKIVARKTKIDHVHDLILLAIMKADAGKGVSTDPDDYFADDPDLELKIRAALSVVPSDDYDPWFRIGAAIYSALGDSTGGRRYAAI